MKTDFLTGEKIAALADIKWAKGRPLEKRSAVVYATTYELRELFDAIRNNPSNTYIVITHNSDVNITEELYNLKPPNVLCWFSQNVMVNKPDLIAVPIGIANSEWRHGNLTDLYDAVAVFSGIPSILCSLQCKVDTNPRVRRNWVESLRVKPWAWVSEEFWTPRNRYFFTILQSKYVACPPGNGIDTHRFWEVLFAGRIPIVQDHAGIRSFNAPCLIVNKPQEITEGLLLENYESLQAQVHAWKPDIACMPYWENLIQVARNQLFTRHLQKAADIVAHWPTWKREIL